MSYVANFRKHQGKELCVKCHDSYVFSVGRVAVAFGRAAQEYHPDAPHLERVRGQSWRLPNNIQPMNLPDAFEITKT